MFEMMMLLGFVYAVCWCLVPDKGMRRITSKQKTSGMERENGTAQRVVHDRRSMVAVADKSPIGSIARPKMAGALRP